MIKGKINAIKKASKRIWEKEANSMAYYNCLSVIEALEKLDSGQEITNDDLNYIKYPFYLFEGNVKKIGEWYFDYYCR